MYLSQSFWMSLNYKTVFCPFQPLKFLIWLFLIHSILSFPSCRYTRCFKWKGIGTSQETGSWVHQLYWSVAVSKSMLPLCGQGISLSRLETDLGPESKNRGLPRSFSPRSTPKPQSPLSHLPWVWIRSLCRREEAWRQSICPNVWRRV